MNVQQPRPSLFSVFRLAAALALLLVPSAASAVVLDRFVTRDLTDNQGRILSVCILEVTTDSLVVLRTSDSARFTIPCSTLSQPDRDFATSLLADAQLSATLPDTPWLEAVRRDFRIFDPTTRRLVSPPRQFTETQPWVIIGIDCMASGFPSVRSIARLRPTPDPQKVLLLWLPSQSTALGIELEGETLAPGAAILSYDAMKKATLTTMAVANDARNTRDRIIDQRPNRLSRSSRSREGDSENAIPNPFRLTDEERQMLMIMASRQLPSYWPRPPFHGDLDPDGTADNKTLYPCVYLYHRNGTPVRRDNKIVQGHIQDVLRLINEKSRELR